MTLNSSTNISVSGKDIFACSLPTAKLSLSINAFNGNTTNFNKCVKPSSKSMASFNSSSLNTQPVSPTQPAHLNDSFVGTSTFRPKPGMMMPM